MTRFKHFFVQEAMIKSRSRQLTPAFNMLDVIVNDQLTPPINPALNLAEYSQLKRMRNTAWINRLLIRLSRMETT